MHPSSIISFYPTYAILDEIVSLKNYKNINFFFDMKNIANSLYMKHAVLALIENTEKYKIIDSSIFNSLLSFISFHKLYSLKRNLNAKFFVFFETGQSYYHHNIFKKYKIKRKIDDLFGLDREKRDIFFDIIHKNLRLIERACNKMPDIKVIMLPHLEADFVPYYIQRNNILKSDENTVNITYSNDHDMWQNLNEDSYIFAKTSKDRKIIQKGQAMSLFCKKKVDIDDSFFPLAMAITGDTSDDIPGVYGIGPGKVSKVVEEIAILGGGMDLIYENVKNNKPLFKQTDLGHKNDIINSVILEELNKKTISTNLKLISFEILSKLLDDPPSTEMLDKRKRIESILNENSITPYDNMVKALNMSKIYVDEDVLETIYYQRRST